MELLPKIMEAASKGGPSLSSLDESLCEKPIIIVMEKELLTAIEEAFQKCNSITPYSLEKVQAEIFRRLRSERADLLVTFFEWLKKW